MASLVKPLTSKEIVAFELAKTPEAATTLIKEWQEKDLIGNAKKSIYLDFIFLVLYSVSIGLGCSVLSKLTESTFLIQAGFVLSRIIALAGLCDVIENLAMLKSISGDLTAWSTAVAFWFASVKFLVVVCCLLFVVSCLVIAGVKRILRI